MPELSFHIEKVEVEPFAVSPQMMFKLRLSNHADGSDPHRRPARPDTDRGHRVAAIVPRRAGAIAGSVRRARALGPNPARHCCGRTPAPSCPPSKAAPMVESARPLHLRLQRRRDQVFRRLAEGDIPVCVQFSGTVFYTQQGGPLQVMPIPWDKEVHFRLPVELWKRADGHLLPRHGVALPASATPSIACIATKWSTVFPTWEQALESMFRAVEEEVKP